MKKKIAIIRGGYSSEIGISKKSADTIYSNIDTTIYEPFIVEITQNEWSVFVGDSVESIDKSNFSFSLNGSIVVFDVAFITIHGTPGEDGKLQAYFDMINLPYVNSGVLASSLTFNKWACNQFLKGFDVDVAKSVLLRSLDAFNIENIGKKLGFPCFVKPNDGGSSFGISKVNELSGLENAIVKAFSEGSEVIIESILVGREITCGVYNNGSKIVAFELTEILTENEFFDYEAKYNGASNEITPAKITEDLKREIQRISIHIYKLMGLCAMARIDYIVSSQNKISLIEVNTNPGMTDESIVPQQIKVSGLKLKTVITEIIELIFTT